MKKKVFWKLAVFGLTALVFTAAGCRKVTDPPTSAPEDEIPVVKVSVNITPAAAAAHVTVKHNGGAPKPNDDGTITAKEGDTVSFDIADAARSYLGTVTVDSQTVSTFPHSITVAQANIDIVIPFTMEQHAVSVTQPAEGGGAEANVAEAYPLETVTITLTPDTTEDDTSWLLDTLAVTQNGGDATTNTAKISDNTYTFVMPNYAVDITASFSRTISENALLASLAPDVGALDQTFDAETLEYEVVLGPEVAGITFDYTTAHPDAQAGLTVDSSRALDPLVTGITTAHITVTAQDDTTTKEYVITIKKMPSAALASLVASGADFSGYPYTFNTPVAGSTLTITLPYNSEGVYNNDVTLNLTPLYPTATTAFTYSGAEALTGVNTATATTAVAVSDGATATGSITVTASADGLEDSKTYAISLKRYAAPAQGISGANRQVVYYDTTDNTCYESHIFTTNGTLAVSGTFANALLFAVGGGGGTGGHYSSNGSTRGQGGGGGTVVQEEAALSSGDYAVVVGAGGNYGNGGNGQPGGTTTITGAGVSVSAAGGNHTSYHNGDSFQGRALPSGSGAGTYGYSGAATAYGFCNGSSAGSDGSGSPWNKTPPANSGMGGGTTAGGGSVRYVGIPGAAGIVIVRVPAAAQ